MDAAVVIASVRTSQTWRTAVDAAPYLLGEEARDGETPPAEAFEKLEPFKDLVSEDIRSGPEGGRRGSD
jgi:hypothetical protein